ncbi:MAG TPA: hypothetical protein H9685_00070 [Firmicutes bacterium]|nr:hypothetical protein [Bacillota bacterium]
MKQSQSNRSVFKQTQPQKKFTVAGVRNCILIVIFALYLAAAFVFVVVLPKDEASGQKENRTLASFPEFSFQRLFDGEFTSEFETYLSDNVGYRSVFTDIASVYNSNKGISSFGKIVETQGDLGTGSTTDSRLVVTEDKVMEVYDLNEEAREKYIEMVNFYAEKLPQEINLYAMLMPTQIDFLPMYNTVGDSERESINYFYENFSDRVHSIDVYDTLKEHYDNGEYVYFRTDHHWTTLGAYYAYNKMSGEMGIPSLDINNFEQCESDDFLGYLYNQAQEPRLANHKDIIYYYKNYMNDIPFSCVTYSYVPGERFDYSGKIFNPELGATYNLFMGGDQPFIDISTAAGTNKTLLMIKDSYSNALIPWLACGYSKILVIDARTFDQKITDILAQYPVDDFLITNYIIGTNFTDYIELCHQIYE